MSELKKGFTLFAFKLGHAIVFSFVAAVVSVTFERVFSSKLLGWLILIASGVGYGGWFEPWLIARRNRKRQL